MSKSWPHREHYRQEVNRQAREAGWGLNLSPDADYLVWVLQTQLGLPADGLLGSATTGRALEVVIPPKPRGGTLWDYLTGS